MHGLGGEKQWRRHGMRRRQFLRDFGVASSALTFSPFFLQGAQRAFAQTASKRVYKVVNGDCFQNMAKLLEMMGGVEALFDPTDVVVIKGNAQWPNQGYTHTGCIKALIDQVLSVPNFSGEALICDNTQYGGRAGRLAFDVTTEYRQRNWPDHNWSSLADEYQAAGKPVRLNRWWCTENEGAPNTDISGPQDGPGWIRDFFLNTDNDQKTYLAYPIFASPVTEGRLIDMQKGIWEDGAYTPRRLRTIFMPTLNNHGRGDESYAGITGAIKSFFGATEIHYGVRGVFRDYLNIHNSSYSDYQAVQCGRLVARFMQTMYAPDLFITAAMWAGHESRVDGAIEAKTLYACDDPATLDYTSCKDMSLRYEEWPEWLDPDTNRNTRRTILGMVERGIGTAEPSQIEVIAYDFDNPTITRLDVDRIIRDFQEQKATEQDVKDAISEYMEEG